MTTELAVIDANYAPVMQADQIKQQVATIQDVMKAVMHKDEHYGVIPGCGTKPTLLQPGAQKLALTFGFAATYKVDERQLDHGHREYHVTCRLEHRQGGGLVGEGVGCCTTMERKYRYRSESTGKAVPKQYWDSRDAALLGGSSFSPRKDSSGNWVIFHQVDHDNPADHYNTCLKMAKKRAYVDATLTACAASDIFTQDVEDMPTGDATPVKPSPPTASAPQTPAKEVRRPTAPAPAKEGGQGGLYVTEVSVVKEGETNGKPWAIHKVAYDDNGTPDEASTFDATLAAYAQECMDQQKPVDIETKPGRNPQYRDLVSIVEAIGGAPDPGRQEDPPPNPVETTIRKVDQRNAKVGVIYGVIYGVDTDHGRFGTKDAAIGAALLGLEQHLVNIEWRQEGVNRVIDKCLDLEDAPF